MPKPILSSKARMSAAQADRLLKCYAERMSPQDAAKRAKVSVNTAYKFYDRLRWRLIHVGYYRDAALSKDEDGLSPAVKQELMQRRGIQGAEVYAHAAEAIEWVEEWPPGEVLRHLRKIVELTRPLDVFFDRGNAEFHIVSAFVQYARLRLVATRASETTQSAFSNSAEQSEVHKSVREAFEVYRSISRRLRRR